MQSVAIIGLGYVGLPLACLCAEKGYSVKGIDLDKGIVDSTNKGVSHIRDKAIEEALQRVVGKITASDRPDCLGEADVILVCVPTPALGSKPDLRPLKKAVESIAGFLRRGQLVVVESTIYPGTIEEVIQPILEKNGLKAGRDFFLGHCPERIDPGNKLFPLEKISRVLACLSEKGTAKAREFYGSIIDAEIVVLGSVKAAEAVKVVENTFRDVNIAFVNELAMSFDAMGINLQEVIAGASTKPFGFMPFYPGPGVGGHCIAQDPYYLIDRAKKAGFEHQFLQLARDINEGMPEYIVGLVEGSLKEAGLGFGDAKISVFGLAYKPEVDDDRESPGLKIVELLEAKGASVNAFDPFVQGKSTVSSIDSALQGCDCLVLVTHHKQFLQKLFPSFIAEKGVKVVVDARNALDKLGIVKRGIVYKGIGR